MTENKILPFHQLPTKQKRIVAGMNQFFETDDPQKITYSHSVMCQTSMPFKNQGKTERWETRNGKSIVIFKAGEVYDPNTNKMLQLGLPYGTKPRLILLDWNRQAVLTQSPTIEVENTLYAFLKRLKLPTEGRVYAMAKKQLSALAACSMTIGQPTELGGSTGYGKIVNHMNILFSKNKNQRVLWPNTVTLSTDYFDSLMAHAVPLDEEALYLLRDSALELDLYAMLAERLHRIAPNKPQFVPWSNLYEQYGQGYSRINNFRSRFLKHLRNVRGVYQDAKINEIKNNSGFPKGLEFFNSSPPVRKLLVQKSV